jgi:hypothetical protein
VVVWTACGGVDCLYVAQDRHEQEAFVVEATNVRVPHQAGNLLTRQVTTSFSR